MKRTFWMRLWALALILVCLSGSLVGARAELLDWESGLAGWLEREKAIRFSVSAQVDTLLPFTGEQVGRLNGLLKYLFFGASLERDGGAALTAISLSVNGETAMTLSEREESGAFALETSLLPNRTLESSERSPLDALAFDSAEEEDLARFNLPAAISEAEATYQALIDVCEPLAEKKKANYKIKDIGTAKWSQIARLTTDQSDEMLPLLRAVLQSGMDEAHRAELNEVRFGKGFVVALYKLGEAGDDIAVYMKGNLIFPDKTTASLAYQWAFITKDGQRKDTYQYELSRKVSVGPSRTVAASITQSSGADEVFLKGVVEMSIKTKGLSRAETETVELSGKSGGATRTLAGSYSRQRKLTQDGNTKITLSTLTPDLAFIVAGEEAFLSGTVQTEEKTDKTVTSGVTLTFAPELPKGFAMDHAGKTPFVVVEGREDTGTPAGSLYQNAEEDPAFQTPAKDEFLVGSAPVGLTNYPIPESNLTQSVDTLTPDQVTALREEMAQNLAGRLLLSLTGLPAEALAIFQDGMTDEDYASFLSLLSNP